MATLASWSSQYMIQRTSGTITGTATAGSGSGALIASASSFVTNGVMVGDVVTNTTDDTTETVTAVTNATTLATTTGNAWLATDTFSIATFSQPPTFTVASDVGLEGTRAAYGIFRMALINAPHINVGQSTVDHQTTTGLSQAFTTMDMSQVVGEPASVTLEMPLNSYNLSLFSLLLFQSGATEGGSNLLTCIPYTSSATSYYCSVVRVMVDDKATAPTADTLSHILYGGICKSMTITGSENDILRLSVEIVGSYAVAGAATDLTASPATMLINSAVNWNAAAYAFMNSGQEATRVPLKFQDCTTKIGTYGSESAVNFDNFSITISNNATHRYYANTRIKSWILGRLTIEGSVRLPWGDTNYGGNSPINDFVDGTDMGLAIYNTDGAAADGKFDCQMNVRITDTDISVDPEVQTEVAFQGVYDGTNSAINLKVGYSATYLDHIPA